MTNNQQLELGFNSIQRRPTAGHPDDRQVRAAWWFGQMRRIVAGAVDWQATSRPGSQTTWHKHGRTK